MCAKLRTVTASNNGDHAPQSLFLLLVRATHIVFFFKHIPFVVNHTINAMPLERLQQYNDQTRFLFIFFIEAFTG